jgi:hypothetical protein
MWSRSIVALSAGLILALAGSSATADPSDTTKRAAVAFDDGVDRFKRADYQGAARAFLLADELVPNGQAITNAIAAAKRANDFLVVAEAAERVLARGDSGPLGAAAREALADAATRLSAFDTSCDATPCALSIDGKKVAPGRKYVLAGTHDVVAEGSEGARAVEHVNTVAGATYRLALHPQAPARASAPPAAAPPAVGGAIATPAMANVSTDQQPASDKRLSPTFFYIGLGASVVLAGVTTWSSLDTKQEYDKAGNHDPSYDEERLRGMYLRTDLLVVATLLVGGATAYAGIRLVNWKGQAGAGGSPSVAVSIAPTPSGGSLSGVVRF